MAWFLEYHLEGIIVPFRDRLVGCPDSPKEQEKALMFAKEALKKLKARKKARKRTVLYPILVWILPIENSE